MPSYDILSRIVCMRDRISMYVQKANKGVVVVVVALKSAPISRKNLSSFEFIPLVVVYCIVTNVIYIETSSSFDDYCWTLI